MKFDPEGISESKREFRTRLAARSIAEKLRLLDALRERTLSIRRASKSDPAKNVAHRDYNTGTRKK